MGEEAPTNMSSRPVKAVLRCIKCGIRGLVVEKVVDGYKQSLEENKGRPKPCPVCGGEVVIDRYN